MKRCNGLLHARLAVERPEQTGSGDSGYCESPAGVDPKRSDAGGESRCSADRAMLGGDAICLCAGIAWPGCGRGCRSPLRRGARALVRQLREHILVGLPASEVVRDSWREPDACGIELLKEPHRIAPADKRAGDTRGPASRQLCERLASIPEAPLLRSTSPCRCGVAFERLWTSVFRRDR